jgi:hypothetical protein
MLKTSMGKHHDATTQVHNKVVCWCAVCWCAVCGVLVCGVLVGGVCCAVCYLFVNECIV